MGYSAYEEVFYLIIRGIQQKLDNPEDCEIISHSKEMVSFLRVKKYGSYSRALFVLMFFKNYLLKEKGGKLFIEGFHWKNERNNSSGFIEIDLLLETEEQKKAFSDIDNMLNLPIDSQKYSLAS